METRIFRVFYRKITLFIIYHFERDFKLILAIWLIFNSFVRDTNFKLIASRHLRHLAKCFPDEPTGSVQGKKLPF